jgi:Ca2+-binding RTX toxin-like protein
LAAPLLYLTTSSVFRGSHTVADFESDGILDVAFTDHSFTMGSGFVSVFSGNGNGSVRAPHVLPGFNDEGGLRFAAFRGHNDDFDADGKDDLLGVFQNEATGKSELHVRFGSSDRMLQTIATTVLENPITSSIEIQTPGDIDGDGANDLVVGTQIFLGNGDGTFRPSFQFEELLRDTATAVEGLLPVHFNTDNRVDFLLAEIVSHIDRHWVIAVANADGTYEKVLVEDLDENLVPYVLLDNRFSSAGVLEAGDFNGDGRSDIVDNQRNIRNSGNAIEDFLDPFFDFGNVDASVFFGATDAVSEDFDGDGRLDIVFADRGSVDLSIYLGHGNGTFSSRIVFDAELGAGDKQLLTGDFNNDGKADIVANAADSTSVSLLLGNGDGSFQSALPLSNRPLYAGDFDGDGWLDLATTEYFTGVVYFNVGGGGPRGDEARTARVTEFGGANVSGEVSLTYTLPQDSTVPVTLQIARSSDDVLDASDAIVGTITVSPSSIANSGGALQLMGEAASDALNQGEHTLLVDASAFSFLGEALGNESIQQLFLFADASHEDAISRGTFAPFRGFHLTGDNRAVVRTGPESKTVTIATGNPGELSLRFELSDTAMTTQSASTAGPNEILIVTSSSDDFIHVQHDIVTDTIIRAGDGVNLVVGGAGNDDILGGADTDVLFGEGFDIDVEVFRNFLQNLAARRIELIDLDIAHFGAGQDKINGGDGFDVILGGPGDDELRSGAGGGILFGDGLRLDATLSLDLQPLIDAADLGEAIDKFPAALDLEAGITLDGDGNDTIYGGSGIELVLAGAGNDRFEALAPEDTQSVDGGLIDIILGNKGDDTINDRAARFTIGLGGDGNDVLLGSNSGSFLIGGDDNDTLGGGDGIDVLLGDTLDFGVNSNVGQVLSGFSKGNLSVGFAVGPGDTEIAGDDVLSGGRGFDFEVGGYGNDFLEGGEGAGLLFGDTFSFSATLSIGFGDAANSGSQSELDTRTKSGSWLSKALSLFSVDVDFSLEGKGNDTIIGSTGLDLAFGGQGHDDLFSGGGTVDLLFGNEGDDDLLGGGNRSLLTQLVETSAPDADLLRVYGDRIRNGETLRISGLEDSKFSVMVGGTGSDVLSATPADDGVPAAIGGSVLLGDDFTFLGIPTTPADIFEIRFNGLIPVFFGIEFGVVQEGNGNDKLVGAAGGFNLLIGGNGDDTLIGDGFVDILMGDSLNLGTSITIDFSEVSLDKTIEENFAAIDTSFELPGLAGNGADTIRGGDSFTIAIGGDGPDDIRDGGGAVDLLFGNNGDDEIHAGSGFNLIVGGRDSKNALTPPGVRLGDFLVGGVNGTNVILGDTFQFNTPSLFALGALRDGDIDVRTGLVPAGQGDDIIQGGDGLDLIIGGAGDDIITGGNGTNAILGDALTIGPNPFRFSVQFFQALVTTLFGNANGVLDNATNALGLTDTGNDRIFGGDDTDVVFGGGGNDKIYGRGGFDFLVGGEGDDEVFGDGGRDIVFGGLGADKLHGGEGDDHLESEEGADIFFGGEGNDRIFGGIESDMLFGGPGDDELFGEAGDDVLDGGTGNNTFTDTDGNNTIVERLASDDTGLTTRGVAITLDVLANDGNGTDPILLDSFAQPSSGTVTRGDGGTPDDQSDDVLVFTPADDFVGAASFSYVVRTSDGDTDSATVELIIDGENMDFGDAPDIFRYPTSRAANGARHGIGSLVLGSTIDGEQDALLRDTTTGVLNRFSSGDDANGADEDGVVSTSSIVAVNAAATRSSVAVVASEVGKLDAWIDFDHDGTWSPAEQVFASHDVAAGSNLLSFEIPVGTLPGTTHARFRISSAGGLLPTGPAPDGEVEDYTFTIRDGNATDGVAVVVSRPNAGSIDVFTDGDEFVASTGDTDLLRVPRTVLKDVELLGTDGDDILNLRDLEAINSGIVRSDAGQGNDTLRLIGSGHTFDLTSIAEATFQGIETIDIVGDGQNTLTLTVDRVTSISSSTDTLRVVHDEDDILDVGTGWTVVLPRFVAGDFIHLLEQGGASIEIENMFPYQNPLNRLDTNLSGSTSPLDVLIIINRLNASGPMTLHPPLSDPIPSEFSYVDTNGDGSLAPIDALVVINWLNRTPPQSEGGSTTTKCVTPLPPAQTMLDHPAFELQGIEAEVKISELPVCLLDNARTVQPILDNSPARTNVYADFVERALRDEDRLALLDEVFAHFEKDLA